MRVGFTVTKKIGNAVVRNRMKRRFARSPRAAAGRGLAGADHVLIGRAGGIERDFAPSRRARPRRWQGRAMIARLLILVARGWQKGPSQGAAAELPLQPSCSAYAITAFSAMGRCAAAGWR
jgi:ribonuclease P protein component